MDPRDAILFIAGFLDLFLGFGIFLRNRKSPTYVSFALFNFCLAGWALGIAFFRLTTDLSWALFWAKEYYIAASFIAASLLYFAHVFPEGKPISMRRKLLIVGPSVLHALLLAMPEYLTHKVVVHDWGKEILLGGLEYLLYTAYFLPFFYGALYILWSKYRVYTGLQRRQIRVVLVSVLVASVFGVTFNLILPWFGNYQFIHVGPPFTMVIVWYVSYAIIRHQWLDIRLVAARTLAYSLLVTIVGVFYIGVSFLISSFFLRLSASRDQLMVYMLLTIVVAFSFDRLKKLLDQMTDRIFFKAYYDSNQLLYTLGSIMSTTIELKGLTEKVLETLLSQMRIGNGSFLLFDKDALYETISVGFEQKPQYHYSQIMPLIGDTDVVVFDELPEGVPKDVLRRLEVSVSLGLRVKNETVGLLFLGAKASGDIYSDQDIKLLAILASEVAVAIRNAQSYDQIKRFNITLSEEVRTATAHLTQANARLKEVDKLKDDFVSIASHELRTPMTAIKSYLWMGLHRRKHELSPDIQRYLNAAFTAVDRLITLVNEMLNVSRIEGGRVTLTLKSTDIINLVKETVQELAPRAQEKAVAFQVIEEAVPRVLCDPDKIREVLLNLLGNAMKFTPSGGRVITRCSYTDPMVSVSVNDTGIGMSGQDIARLFTKFGRLDDSYQTRGDSTGTGLGLYISKSLVQLHKGTITGTSRGINQGSSFTFSLPAMGTSIAAELTEHPASLA